LRSTATAVINFTAGAQRARRQVSTKDVEAKRVRAAIAHRVERPVLRQLGTDEGADAEIVAQQPRLNQSRFFG